MCIKNIVRKNSISSRTWYTRQACWKICTESANNRTFFKLSNSSTTFSTSDRKKNFEVHTISVFQFINVMNEMNIRTKLITLTILWAYLDCIRTPFILWARPVETFRGFFYSGKKEMLVKECVGLCLPSVSVWSAKSFRPLPLWPGRAIALCLCFIWEFASSIYKSLLPSNLPFSRPPLLLIGPYV